MKLTVISIVVVHLGQPEKISKGSRRRGNNRTGRDHLDKIIIKTGRNTEPAYWEEFWRLEKICSHSSEKPSYNAGVKNFQRVNTGKVIYRELSKKLKFCWPIVLS